jgi:tetratricopeptide (TPR) repeat protein
VVDVNFIRDRLLKEVLSGDYPDEARSVLLYQAGQILELQGGANAEAMRQYLLSLKLDDDFMLPVLSAGSILLGAASHQRLTKLYHMALDKAQGRMASLLSLFLAESLEASPVEGLDRLGLLETVRESPGERVLSLVLEEWERCTRDELEERLTVIERWKDATEQPLVRSQLSLELARHLVERGEVDRVWHLLDEVQEDPADVFPRFSESVRLGLATGDRARTIRMVLTEARRLAGEESAPAEALSGRFLLASPADARQAAALLAGLAWQLGGGDPSIARESDVTERMATVLDALDPGVILHAGLDGIAIDHYMAAGRIEDLERYLEATASRDGDVSAAWNLWCRARAALAGGRFDDVRGLIGQIRALGFDSRVLDALESLGGGPAGATDRLGTIIGLESRWSSGEDVEALARSLAGMDALEDGLADLAYVAARESGDSFLRQKALAAWSERGGSRADDALVDLIRLHAFERPDSDALAGLLGTPGDEPGAARMFAALAGATRLVAWGRGESAEPWIRAFLGRARGAASADDVPGADVAFVCGTAPEAGAPRSPGPLDVHALVRMAAQPGTAGAAVRWLAAVAADGSPGLEPRIAGAAASLALAGAPADADVSGLTSILLDPSFGLDSATRLGLSLRVRDPARILEVLGELSEELEPGEARAALRIVAGLRRLFEEGDADAALESIDASVADDPAGAEALFAMLLLGPMAGRWNDVCSALDALLPGEAGDSAYEVAWRRVRMILAMVIDGDPVSAADQAGRILGVRGGDPVSLLVRMAAARAAGDLDGYASDLGRLALWFGDPRMKGSLAHHQIQLGLLDGAARPVQDEDDRLPAPDPSNLSPSVATAVLNGPVDLTESGIAAALEENRTLTGAAHRARAFSELGELAEAAGQGRAALGAFVEALDADPLDPAAIEGVMRLAPRLGDDPSLARATQARAGLCGDPKRKLKLLLRAADLHSKDEAGSERAAACYQEAAELDPSDPRSFTGLLRAMELRGDMQGVIDVIERRVASTMELDEIEALQLKLADLKRRIKDFDGALVALDDLLIVQPNKVTAWRMKLDILLQLERFEEALDAADQLLDYADEPAARVAVLHKCISVSLARVKDLRRGLGYCLQLVRQGQADENLVNKTMRLALRLEAWDEAASLQQDLADAIDDPARRQALLIKKAEIYLRYAKQPEEAAGVYTQILTENPVAWEALMRWNASRGAQGLSAGELEPFVRNVRSLLEDDPLREDALTFLVKASRLLKDAGAARYYDTILGLVRSGDAGEAPRQPARTSMAPMVPQIPQGVLPEQEVKALLGAEGPGSLVAGALSNISGGGGLEQLQADGLLPGRIDVEPLEPQQPLARQILAWGEAFGVPELELEKATGLEEGVRLSGPATLVVDGSIALPVPDVVLFRAGMILGCLSIRVPLMAMLDLERITEIVKAGFMASGVDGSGLDPAAGTPELAERLGRALGSGSLSRLASLHEVAPAADAAAIVQGLRDLRAGMYRAGVLVSASVLGMLAQDGRDGDLGAAREFFETESHLRDGLSFALSSRFARLRKLLGLDG